MHVNSKLGSRSAMFSPPQCSNMLLLAGVGYITGGGGGWNRQNVETQNVEQHNWAHHMVGCCYFLEDCCSN